MNFVSHIQRSAITIAMTAIFLAAAAPAHSQAPGNQAGGPQAGTWGKRASLPKANSETAVAQLGDSIYVLGGYPSTRITVTDAQVYDANTDGWKQIAPLPEPLNHAMAAAAGGKVYIMGGAASAGGRGRRPPVRDATYEFDPATGKWTPKAAMPRGRNGGSAAAIGGKIYVVGGRPPHGADFSVYDPKADTWTVLPDMPTQRNHMTAAVIGAKLYVAGGRFGPSFRAQRTGALEIYDPVTKRWTKRPAMPKPRGGTNAVAANGCLHVFGGEGNDDAPSGVFPDHDVFNPQTGKWQSLGPMRIPIHGVTGAAFIGGLIHIPGGGTRIGGSSGAPHRQVFRPVLDCR